MVSVHLHFLLTESGKEVGSDFSLPAAFVCVCSFRVQQRSGQRIGRCHLIYMVLCLQPPKLRTERTKKSNQPKPPKPVPLRQFMMAEMMRKK